MHCALIFPVVLGWERRPGRAGPPLYQGRSSSLRYSLIESSPKIRGLAQASCLPRPPLSRQASSWGNRSWLPFQPGPTGQRTGPGASWYRNRARHLPCWDPPCASRAPGCLGLSPPSQAALHQPCPLQHRGFPELSNRTWVFRAEFCMPLGPAGPVLLQKNNHTSPWRHWGGDWVGSAHGRLVRPCLGRAHPPTARGRRGSRSWRVGRAGRVRGPTFPQAPWVQTKVSKRAGARGAVGAETLSTWSRCFWGLPSAPPPSFVVPLQAGQGLQALCPPGAGRGPSPRAGPARDLVRLLPSQADRLCWSCRYRFCSILLVLT